MTPRTLLSVIPAPVYGGAANHCVQLRDHFAHAGWRIVAALPDEPGNAVKRLEAAGVEVRRVPMHRLRATRSLRSHAGFVAAFAGEVRALAALADEVGADVVQNHGDLNPHAGLAGRRANRAVVWHIQDTRTPPALRHLTMALATRCADAVTTIGWELGRAHPGVLGLGPRHVTVFPPVDVAALRRTPEAKQRGRRALEVADGTVAVGLIGNRNPQKGLDWFARAVAAARTEPAIAARVIGSPSPGHEAYETAALSEAGRLGDLQVIDPDGPVTELLHGLDVLVVASVPNSEGVPTVAMEAMAAGIPVISTAVGAVGEVVRDGIEGLVVPPRDTAALASAIAALVSDPARRDRMGAAGRERMTSEFTTERCAAAHLHAYQLALEHAAGRS